MDDFTQGYIECMLFAPHENGLPLLDIKSGVEGVSVEAVEDMERDCKKFQEENAALLEGLDLFLCGHDFWQTRYEHGNGFKNRNLGERGERLTEACKAFSRRHVQIGDDNLVYFV